MGLSKSAGLSVKEALVLLHMFMEEPFAIPDRIKTSTLYTRTIKGSIGIYRAHFFITVRWASVKLFAPLVPLKPLKCGTTESNKTPHIPHTGTGLVSAGPTAQ